MRALLFVCLAASLSTCTKAPSLLDRIFEQGELRFVTRNSPTTYYLGPRRAQGIELELAKGFAAHLGVDLVVETAENLAADIPGVLNSRVHIAATGLAVSPDLGKSVSLGPIYQTTSTQIIYRRGTRRPRTVSDLLGKNIAVAADTDYERMLSIAARDFPNLAWQSEPDASIESLIQQVTSGAIDYTLVDSNLFTILRQYHPEAGVGFTLTDAQPIQWTLSAFAPKLREQVFAYFAAAQANGTLSTIIDRHYSVASNFDYVGSRAFMRHVESRLPLYLDQFQAAAETTGFDWRLLAAISYQESHWRVDAVSPTGVRGLMMLTEDAAAIVEVSDRVDPDQSIAGGARYLANMRQKIPDRIQDQDRLWMALAAYNIGFGHLEDARIITQINGANPDKWNDVKKHLPLLTDEHWHSQVRRGYARGDVPVLYVENIKRYYQLLQWIGDDVLESYRRRSPPLKADAPTTAQLHSETPAPISGGY